MTLSSTGFGVARALWFGAFLGAVALSTFGFACAAPFAGMAAVAALAETRRVALTLTASAWLVNQIAGFAFLHYPTDPETLAWGGGLLAVALASCEAARLAAPRAGALAAFLASFAVYEGLLYAATVATGGMTEHYALESVARIFLINAIAFAVLFATNRLAVTLAARRARGLAYI
jgi:hypothetical protein